VAANVMSVVSYRRSHNSCCSFTIWRGTAV